VSSSEVESSRMSLASRTVLKVLGLELSRPSKIGLSSVENSSFYLALKSFIFSKNFFKRFLFGSKKHRKAFSCFKIVIVSFKTKE